MLDFCCDPTANWSSSSVFRGLLYGVNAGPQESPHRRQLLSLLAHASKALSIQRHVVVGPNGHQVPLFTSVDAQGLLGADRRFYLLDVFRTFPADANFCPEENKENLTTAEAESGESSQGDVKEVEKGWPENYKPTSGLPKSFPHRLCRLRPELVQAFIQHKWVQNERKHSESQLKCVFFYNFVYILRHCQFTQLVREKLDENGGFEECATASKTYFSACKQMQVCSILHEINSFIPADDSRATDAIRAACKEVGSISDIIFEMRFNPNVFSPGV